MLSDAHLTSVGGICTSATYTFSQRPTDYEVNVLWPAQDRCRWAKKKCSELLSTEVDYLQVWVESWLEDAKR